MSPAFVVAVAAVVGCCLGSFLNVVAYRLPRGLSWVRGRSACPMCGEPIGARDNVPLLSFLVLLGACRHCSHPIPWRYPAVEALFGALTATVASQGLAARPNAPEAWIAAGLAVTFLGLLLVVTLVDIERRLIPGAITMPGVGLGLVGRGLVPALSGTRCLRPLGFPEGDAVLDGVLGAAAAAGFLWLVGAVGARLAGREAMGFGDVKLVAMLGAWLGLVGAGLALMVAVVSGAAVGIVILVVRRSRYVPFGPFLALGGASLVLAGDCVRHVAFVAWPALLARILG